MNFKRMLAKIHLSAKHRLETASSMKLGSGDDLDIDWKTQQSQTILQLRNKVHNMDIEIMKLKFELEDNKRLRQDNKSVKNAWEQYQIVLKLAKR